MSFPRSNSLSALNHRPHSLRRWRPGNPGRDASSGSSLPALAAGHGIQLSYLDVAGRAHKASPGTLRALLELFGVTARNETQARDALREQKLQRARQIAEPVVVAWDGQPASVELRLPAHSGPGDLSCRLLLEDGQVKRLPCDSTLLRSVKYFAVEGANFRRYKLALPRLPSGYHRLEFENRGRLFEVLVISAPTKSYSPARAPKTWGAFLPMYAVHSKASWGAGNLGDWRKLADWIGSLGGRVVSTLPLLAAYLDSPVCEPSPYSPASRIFWNEFYVDIPAAPEFSRCPRAQKLVRSARFQQRLKSFRDAALIDYPAQAAVRREVLEILAEAFFRGDSARRRNFRRYLREHPRAVDYAEFRATCDQANTSWRRWDPRLRHGKLQPGDFSEPKKNYHLYVQWLAHEQMGALLKSCSRSDVQFYLDLPLGVHPDGYDMWRERDVFAFPASVGAPPDAVFTKGQNWGFAPPHPERIRQGHYKYLLDYLRFQMRHTGMLRLDHVMGLHRLFWIPPGLPASEGAFVDYRADELYAILSLESHRHRTTLVGENLGTVPPEVNQAMTRHGLREMYVVQYECAGQSAGRLRSPPPKAVASLNTHDMPPFASYWTGLDLADHAALGLIPKARLSAARRSRREMNEALAKFLFRAGWLKTTQPDAACLVRACLEWLASGRAETVLLNLEDLWQETRCQNLPGTSVERPNWRRKSRCSLEELRASPPLRDLLRRINRLRKKRSEFSRA